MIKNIKKWFLIIISNLTVIIIMLLVLNYIAYKYLYPRLEAKALNNSMEFIVSDKYIQENNLEELNPEYREPVGLDYKNGNILIFGCSYAYGYKLPMKETFQYKISERLKRPVYNYSSPGQAPQFALMKIRSHTIDDIIKKSDYAVLVTISEHIWRVHCNSGGFPLEYAWPRYDVKNNKLVYHIPRFSIIETSYLYKYIRKLFFAGILSRSKSQIARNYLFDLIKLHYIEIKNDLEKINPNIKVVIIVYAERPYLDWFVFSERWKELEEEGFTVIQVNKYIPQLRGKKEYMIPNDGHPTGKAWTEITELITDKLKAMS